MGDSTLSKRKVNKSGKKPLLRIDSYIDTGVYSLFSKFSNFWDDAIIFFSRFKITGFTGFLYSLISEGITLCIAGLLIMMVLALPAHKITKKDWRTNDDLSVTFLDRYGNEIGTRGIRQNDGIAVDQLPSHFINAVLATEDRRFFHHFGIDFIGLARAMIENTRANSVVQGGSTLTQQLAKNLFLSNERTFTRKVNEAFIALWLEINYSKKEILKLYLDRAYMGGGNFGAAAAADYYFGKNIKNVNLAEAAMLAGLFKAPTKYAPHINLPAARARANEVLSNMVEAEILTKAQILDAQLHPATIVERNIANAPDYFLDWAYEEVKKLADQLPTRTLVVKTTLDQDLQNAAEESIQSHLRQFGEQFGVKQSAMVAIERGGAVRAIVGGRDYGESQFNRATEAKRQPGSSFKPFVYLTAMERNDAITPHSRVVDRPVNISGWSPRNYSGGYRGGTTVMTALMKSINTVPVILAQRYGRKNIVDTARRLGFTSPMSPNPSMPLGTNEVSVMEMTNSYAHFMSGGLEPQTHGILLISDRTGKLLYRRLEHVSKSKRLIDPTRTGYINQILAQVPIRGTARRAALAGILSAGKTGTTQAYRDAWFVGYTGNFTAAVWYGNDGYQPTKRLTGGRLPAQTWQKFMTFAHKGIKIRPLPYIGDLYQKDIKAPEPEDTVETAKAIKKRQKILSQPTIKVLKKLISDFKRFKIKDNGIPIVKNRKPDVTQTSLSNNDDFDSIRQNNKHFKHSSINAQHILP